MAVNSAARMWSRYKELYNTVDAAIFRKLPDAVQDLDVALRKHKPDFISLLRNPAKNNAHRETVKKADREGITIEGDQAPHTLTQEFIQEALIISDIFDLNEFAAVELLLAGENQQPNFPGLTRGLVAVLLYYDGRRSLVNSLRTLIQSREGNTWTLGLNEELVDMTTRFTKQLMDEGLISKTLERIKGLDFAREYSNLQTERALGNARHRKRVTDLYNESRLSLAECIFCWAAQTPLDKNNTLQLIAYLRNDDTTNPDGTLDSVTIALMMALLFCLDAQIVDQEDTEEILKRLPALSDPSYIPAIHKELTSNQAWANPGLKAIAQFAWGLSLRVLSQHSTAPDLNEYCEEDEMIVGLAVQENVFTFLKNSVLNSTVFHQEEYYMRKMHNLITEFIVHMPLKIKEMRNHGDETARIIMAHLQEGLEPPGNLRRDFENFMSLIGEFYRNDPLNLELGLEFWCPPDPSVGGGPGAFQTMHHLRPPQRQISLFKFVRLAGDLLPPSLYIPYIEMLTGLANGPQCAHHCFNLLKTSGMNAGGQLSTVSWDHFFMSMNQYYTTLRQEAPSQSDMSHVYHHHMRGITPQELEGLVKVLGLTRMIAKHDENARIALCENQQWLPHVLMLGLVGCSVPPKLKAELLTTLAAFAKTPEIAASLWQSLEVSQLLPTIYSTSVHQAGGIQVELDEVEARNEEFPMTIAFLELLDALTEIPVPAGLGAGYRPPGLDPYLVFIRDNVFLKFNTRAYKHPGEKWQVASCVLKILFKLLNEYEPMLEHFMEQPVELQGGGTVTASKPAGYSLMVHMLNDGGMLKMVLYILDEAAKLLDSYTDFSGKNFLEETSLLCLKLVEVTLEKQEQFFDILRESGSSLIISPLDKLLLGINPRSGKADHLVNVAKYVMHNNNLAEHALQAVKALCWVCQSSLVQPELVGLFTADEEVGANLLHGFVECIEAEDIEDPPIEGTEDSELSLGQIRNATRQNIMRLILYTIDQPAPTLAHFLMGYELRRPLVNTVLQDPGISGTPKTCLHAILDLLGQGLDNKTGPTCLIDTPKLAELAYHTVYELCANRDVSSATLRYLRTTHDFLYKQLLHMPFSTHTEKTSSINQQSWLLKTVAIELRVTSMNRQRSHTQRLLNLLLDDSPALASQTGLRGDGQDTDFSQTDADRSIFGLNDTRGGVPGQTRRKILRLLDMLSFTQEYPQPLNLEFFEPSVIEQVIASRESKNDESVIYCNVKSLHKILMNELNNLQGSTAAGQRLKVLEEIQNILANVVQKNSVRESIHAKRQAFNALRQVIEIILNACPMDLISGEKRQLALFEITQDLLVKVSDEDALPDLMAPVAGLILTLISNLRQCFISDQSDASIPQTSHYISLLDNPAALTANQTASFGQNSGSKTMFASSLQVVLRGIIDFIMRTSGGQQRVRANLYGALLFYLQIAKKPQDPPLLEHGAPERGVGAALATKVSEYEQLTSENVATISSYGPNFIEIICKDACDGHDVGRMLALAALDAIVDTDRHHQWLQFMTSKGYLQHLIDSLLQDNEQLQAMLNPSPEPLKALYIYESKMSLLTRLAESASGAQTLLQLGVMARLVECTVLDMRPETDRQPQGDVTFEGFVPSVMSRFRQLLFPALKLCIGVLTSLGVENREAAYQILQFIVAHGEVFTTILRNQPHVLQLDSLKEVALVTAVLSRAAIESEDNVETTIGDTSDIEFKGHLSRIQRQMIALLPKYVMTQNLQRQLRDIEGSTGDEGGDVRMEMEITIQEIASNVVAYCRAIISKSGPNAAFTRVLFNPNLQEATARNVQEFEDLQSTMASYSRPPNLGLIVYQLRQCTNSFMTVFDSHSQFARKLKTLADLGAEELKELCGRSAGEKLSTQQRQAIARKRLLQILGYKVQELQLYSYIIENCLFILWRHLEYFLQHCEPLQTGSSLLSMHSKKQESIRRLQEMPTTSTPYRKQYGHDASLDTTVQSGVGREDLEKLKMDALSCINESLFKKLQDIEQCYIRHRTRYCFMEAVVRRLKRLLTLHTRTS
ncbi:unnamed protein product [Owenia fusiformis]|uniref:Uncharacterized protein n=1 Tax=Owenia fusiformis TaxID=6347 RepID=A0A8J1TCG4_OWEFU|nr:unnamed protein product [Owenia fusiformis]